MAKKPGDKGYIDPRPPSILQGFEPLVDYCGPGPHTVHVDAKSNYACYLHDKEYGQLGKRAYIFPSDADDRFIKRLRGNSDRSFLANIAYHAFEAKIIPSMPFFRLKNTLYAPEKKMYAPTAYTPYGRQYSTVSRKRVRSLSFSPNTRVRMTPAYGKPATLTLYRFPHYPYLKRSYAKMPKRRYAGKTYRNGYRSKYRRFNYIRRISLAAARKVLKKALPEMEATRLMTQRGYHGITGGAAGPTATPFNVAHVPAVNRQVAWGRTFFGSRNAMNLALNTGAGAVSFSGEHNNIVLGKYVEKHTVQNTCLFPVVVTVYKHYFKDGWLNITENGDLPDIYDTVALETGIYASTEILDNQVTPTTGTPDATMGALCELWKANLTYNAPLPAYTTGITDDPDRSWCLVDTGTLDGIYGVDANLVPGVMVRPFGMIKFNIPQLQNVKFYKKQTYILAPGQQFSVTLRKGRTRCDFKDIGNDPANEETSGHAQYMKGACGFTFEAHGLMSHASGVSPLTQVARSSFKLACETTINWVFKISDIVANPSTASNSLVFRGATFTNDEVVAGLKRDEAKIDDG